MNQSVLFDVKSHEHERADVELSVCRRRTKNNFGEEVSQVETRGQSRVSPRLLQLIPIE
jgi:hypothetical protein